MRLVRITETIEHANSDSCVVHEYPMDYDLVNGAVAQIYGRYPADGVVYNQACTEMAFVLGGSGRLVIGDAGHHLDSGDLVLIEPNEQYYWEGNMRLFIAATPAWTPEQHKQWDNKRPQLPDWAPTSGPWCLMRWIPLGVDNPEVDTCMLRLQHEESQCRGIHGQQHHTESSLYVGQLANKVVVKNVPGI